MKESIYLLITKYKKETVFKLFQSKIILLIILFLTFSNSFSATISSTNVGGNWSTGTSWVGGIVPATTDNIIITNGATITLIAASSIANITINTGGTLKIGTINALTVTGDFVNNGTFSGTTGRLILTGLTKNFSNYGNFTMGSGRIYFYGNLINAGTHTLIATQIRFYGTSTQTITGFSTTGTISCRKTGGTVTFTGNVNGGGLTMNGTNCTLNLGSSLTHNFTGNITLTAGNMNGSSSLLNVKSISITSWTGNGSLFTAGTGTVNFSAAGNQTLSATSTTFNNLTFSSSGLKTLTTNRCIVNGILSIEGTATVSSAPTYGNVATLLYNTSIARNSGVEWITPFTSSGGIIISNTGSITLNSAKVLNASIPLLINNTSTLITNNFQLTFGGNFTNNGTFTAGSSPIVITNTTANQSIAGFTSTGPVSMTKTAGVATLLGNVIAGKLTINGNGGTLNLGTLLTHNFNDIITLTAGTLNANSSIMNVKAISTTAWSGNGALFTAGTGTVNFAAAGNQTISASPTTFNNLTFSSSGIKTFTTANCIASGIVTIQDSATVLAPPTYGTNATLKYDTSTSRIAGLEWITPFAGLGGVIIANTGAITMNLAKTFNTSSPLTINIGSTLITNNLPLTFGGSFINNGGVFTAGSTAIIINGTMTNQNIAGFATTGQVSMTKTAGIATFTGNTNGSDLIINGNGGTLNLGINFNHTYTSNFIRTAGTINGGSSSLNIAGLINGTGGTFIASTGTINYNGTSQTVVALPYYNISLSGSGTKTFLTNTIINNVLNISSGVTANLGIGNNHTCIGLSLGGVFQIIGSWGGTTSGAANINSTYFTSTTGKIFNNCSVPAITTQPTSPTITCSGNGIQTLTVIASGSGLTYNWRKSGVAVINNSVISGQGTSSLIFTNPTNTHAGSYDVVINGTCTSFVTSNSVTISINPSPNITSQPIPLNVCQNTNGSFTIGSSDINLSYQWQYSSNPITSWTNTNSLIGFTGHTSNTLNITNASLVYSNYNFRCVLTNTNGCITNSNAALLNVNSTPLVGTSSSNQSICSGSFLNNDITISNANGTIQWQKANDAAFTNNVLNIGINSTTLTINQIGSLNVTTYFRAVVSNGNCAPAISNTIKVTIETTTWTSANGGSWDNGLPSSIKTAIISNDYTSIGDGNGSFNACSLLVNNNAKVKILSGDNLSLNTSINIETGSSLILENNANLFQNQDAINTGNISINRNTNSLMRLDYAMWSSPVLAQNLLAFSPLTYATRFYQYNTSTNLYNTIVPSTTNFETGKGYLIRVPNSHPTTPTVWSGTYTGVPNNGSYDFALTNVAAGFRFNAIGNPYPSTLDMDQFVTENSSNITGTLYFWRKTNSTITTPGYCTWNSGTFVSNGEAQVFDPNGVIQVGQGFIVEALDTGSNIVFNNSQRINDNSNQTFRNTNEEADGRFWLNLTSTANEFSQMAVAYLENATSGIDKFDAKYFNDAPISLNTTLETIDYVIQSRAWPFENTDTIQLSYKVTNAGNYTITLDHYNGFFLNNNQEIYLRDLILGTYTNLNSGSYTFASEAGSFSNRFEIVYQTTLAVNNTILNSNKVVVYKNNNDIIINTGNIAIKNIKIFDVSGRLLIEKLSINSTEIKINTESTRQVLLVQITSEDNSIITKKIVN